MNENERIEAEGRAIMQDVQVEGEDMGAHEVLEHGHLLALEMIIQCDGCLRREVETPLRVTLMADDSGSVAEKLVDLVLVCEKCTAEAQQQDPKALVAIPVDVLVGDDVQFDEIADDGLPSTDGDEQPFDGDVKLQDPPVKLPVE